MILMQVRGDLGGIYNIISKTINQMHDLAAIDGNNLEKEWAHFLGKASSY